MERKMSCTSINEDSRFDEVMEKVGYRGKFQKRFNIIFNFFLVLTASMPYMNMILALGVPEHWCHVPGRELTNYTLEEWKTLTLPKENDTRGRESVSKCKMYNLSSYDHILDGKIIQDFGYVDCQFGWEYDDTWYIETAPSEQDWVCENELMVSNALAFGRIGDVLGTFIFGQLGDTIGRQPVFFITLILLISGRLLSAFTAHKYSLFLFSTLLGNLTSVAVFQSPLIIAMEISEEQGRAHIAMIQCLGWNLGMCLLPLVMWAWGHWFYFLLITTLPCVIFLFSSKFIIESPRWLASQGKTVRAIKELKKIAKVNGTTVPADAMITLRPKKMDTEKVYGVFSLFTSWRLAKNTLLLIICCVNGALTYYVILLNINMLGGNPFMNYFWQALAELPAYVLGRICSDRFGRRWSQVVPYIVGGLAGIPMGILITDPNMEFVTSILAAFIKFCVSYSFYAQNLQTLEIYPTCLRQSGLSLGVISASAFGILGPYIVYLGTTYDARYPYLIMTLLCLSGGICASFLPETLNHKLPETLADAHVFGADQKYWSLPKRTRTEHAFTACKTEEK